MPVKIHIIVLAWSICLGSPQLKVIKSENSCCLANCLQNSWRPLNLKLEWETALEKLQWANTKASVDALVNVLGMENPEIPEYERKEFRKKTLKALAEMIENPPLSAGSAATEENFQKWKQWWAANKDTAVLIRKPVEYWGESAT